MAAFSEPALEVGGDYYDFIRVDEEHLGVVIADVSGKGIPGALVMAMLRSILRAESRNNLSPAAVLRVVNECMRKDTQVNVFITMTYAIIDVRRHTLRFARAGHEPLIICGAGGDELNLYTPNGIALGLVNEDIFNITVDTEINLAEGDLVVLYTDGVIEAINNTLEEYSQTRLLNVIKSCHEGKAQEVINAIMADIRQFTKELPQHDDITMIAFKVNSRADHERVSMAESGGANLLNNNVSGGVS
jgi:sigma-B regulation protein RsbU (phosphoserine phosphatase)